MPNKRATTKVVLSLYLEKGLKARIAAAARARSMSVSAFITQTMASALEEAAAMRVVFDDPKVRRLLADMISKPGAIEAMLRAAGESADASAEVKQQVLDSLLRDDQPHPKSRK